MNPIPHFLFTIFIILLFGCADLGKPPPPAPEGRSALPDQELFSAVVRYSQADIPRFTLKTPHLTRTEKEMLIEMDGGVTADFFSLQGEHNATLTAERGQVFENEGRMSAFGNVVVRADDGKRLRCDELHFDQRRNRVYSDGFVTMISPNDSLSGYGFTATPDLKDWEIKNTSGVTYREVKGRE